MRELEPGMVLLEPASDGLGVYMLIRPLPELTIGHERWWLTLVLAPGSIEAFEDEELAGTYIPIREAWLLTQAVDP